MKEIKFKLCLTKQLLNKFKRWCEWGLKYLIHELAKGTLWLNFISRKRRKTSTVEPR